MIYDMTLTSCHDKLIHWLPDSDTIELTDEFQLVNSTWNIKSAVTHSKTFLSHNVILHSSSPRTLKFTFNQTLISRDFSILFRLPKLSIPQTQNSLSKRPVRLSQVLPIDQQPKLRAGCMLFGQLLYHNSRGLYPIIRWFEYQQSICWLSLSLWLTWTHLLAGCQCL